MCPLWLRDGKGLLAIHYSVYTAAFVFVQVSRYFYIFQMMKYGSKCLHLSWILTKHEINQNNPALFWKLVFIAQARKNRHGNIMQAINSVDVTFVPHKL